MFICRSKRRRHSCDVDAVVTLLTSLSDSVTEPPSSSSSSPALSLDAAKSVEVSEDLIVKLNKLLTSFPSQRTQLSAEVATRLSRLLPVSIIYVVSK